MDITAIKSLHAVAEHGSISGAADALALTQPAMTKRLQRLEDDLNVKLLERIGRNVQLTQAGVLLVADTETLLRRWDNVRQKIGLLNQHIAGELHIITSHHIGIHRLPPALKSYYDKHPQVAIKLNFADSEVAYKQIAAGAADFAIVTLGASPFNNIVEHHLWQDRLVVMVANNHPLIGEQVTLKDIQHEQAVLPGLETYTGQIVKRLFDNKGLSLNANMATNYLETVKMMVSVGLGWTILPASMLDESVCQLDVTDFSATRDLGLIHRKSYQPTPAAEAFLELIRKV